MSTLAGSWPCAFCQAAAIRGAFINASICCHFGRPMGPRASSIAISPPKPRNTSTKAPIGAREPKSTMVPAQSKTTALRAVMAALLSKQVGDGFLANGEGGRGAGTAGHHDEADGVRRPVAEHGAVGGRIDPRP